jgi:hypothetical protein
MSKLLVNFIHLLWLEGFSAAFVITWETWELKCRLLLPGGTMGTLFAMETRRLNGTLANFSLASRVLS